MFDYDVKRKLLTYKVLKSGQILMGFKTDFVRPGYIYFLDNKEVQKNANKSGCYLADHTVYVTQTKFQHDTVFTNQGTVSFINKFIHTV